jgi:GT2 family glycosyltransferase
MPERLNGYLDYFGFPFCKGRILHEVEDDADSTIMNPRFSGHLSRIFIRSDAWKEVDGLDEDFFAHMRKSIYVGD